MTGLLRVAGALLAVGATVGLTRASSVSLSPHGAQAVLRLAWTARPERIEDCRQQSEEELSKLPAHMRQSISCVGTSATYRLEVRWNDRLMVQQTVRGGGLRHDRPLYVFRNIDLPAGDAAIRVVFQRLEPGTSPARPNTSSGERDEERHSLTIGEDRRRREMEERTRGREEAIPPSLSVERNVHFESRQVVIITYDAERRTLTVVNNPSR